MSLSLAGLQTEMHSMSQGVYLKIRHNMIAFITLPGTHTHKELSEWYCDGFLLPANFYSPPCPHLEGKKT